MQIDRVMYPTRSGRRPDSLRFQKCIFLGIKPHALSMHKLTQYPQPWVMPGHRGMSDRYTWRSLLEDEPACRQGSSPCVMMRGRQTLEDLYRAYISSLGAGARTLSSTAVKAGLKDSRLYASSLSTGRSLASVGRAAPRWADRGTGVGHRAVMTWRPPCWQKGACRNLC